MPIAPPHLCKCGKIVSGLCPCRRNKDKDRPTSCSRGYDATWQKFRRWFLAHHPLCADCQENGLIVRARDVHHVLKLADRPDLRLDPSNCRGLCTPCHSARTVRGE
jgi:5-methylcytosine-specific restriction protein A